MILRTWERGTEAAVEDVVPFRFGVAHHNDPGMYARKTIGGLRATPQIKRQKRRAKGKDKREGNQRRIWHAYTHLFRTGPTESLMPSGSGCLGLSPPQYTSQAHTMQIVPIAKERHRENGHRVVEV